MSDAILDFERQVLAFLLAGDIEPLPLLRVQLARTRVASRHFSGTGVFTEFTVSAEVPTVESATFDLSDVGYELEGVDNGGGAILSIRQGHLHQLELYNYTDPWPAVARLSTLSYVMAVGPSIDSGARRFTTSTTRDVGALGRAIEGI